MEQAINVQSLAQKRRTYFSIRVHSLSFYSLGWQHC